MDFIESASAQCFFRTKLGGILPAGGFGGSTSKSTELRLSMPSQLHELIFIKEDKSKILLLGVISTGTWETGPGGLVQL